MTTGNPVSACLRERTRSIVERWESLVRAEVDGVLGLERSALIDHLPEVIDALASWVEGDTEPARRGFDALAEGHALQRLGFAIDLESLTREYAILRKVILEELLAVDSSPAVRRSLIDCNDGIDHAVYHSLRRYAARRDETRERFIGILGHDLRNPLNAIVMASSLLAKKGALDATDQKLLATIERSTDRMARMIKDVMDFALGHLGGGIPATPSPVDMGDVCRAAAEELKMANPGRQIELAIEGNLRGSWDRDRVHQALSNLIGNAIQHGKDPIVVRATTDGDHTVVTEVCNGGAPIPEAMRAIMFLPFQRGERKSTSGSGLGMGLFIVRQIALAHGGLCDVVSNEEATRFIIRWPRVPLSELPDRF